jgi:protein-tyrosine phosphatase
MIKKILVVCVGNMCRSPAAEYLMRKRYPHVSVSSAGIGAPIMQAAHPTMVGKLRTLGIDASRHRTRLLTRQMIIEADLILIMEQKHREPILKLEPSAASKLFLLGSYFNEEIPDPINHEAIAFENCFEQLQRYAKSWDRYLTPEE